MTVALFADNDPVARRPRRGRSWIGWTLIAAALVAVTVVALTPAPYVIEKPGPVYNTLGTTSVEGEDVPLIEIPDEETYDTDGSLDMLTVTITGNRSNSINWLDTALAWLSPSQAVVDIDDVYPVGVTVEQSNEQSQVEMQNSQKEAIAAALNDLGYTFSSTLTIAQVVEGSPAEGSIEEGDVITKVNGEKFADVTALKAAIAENGAGTPAKISLVRDGKTKTVEVTPVIPEGATAPIIGVVIGSEYDFPFDVTIQLDNVGGPSAGQMFALGIIDKLTPGSITGGENVAGTGTITASGEVGAIGGIRQKMYGAKDAGAEYFLAPVDNCNEVTGHIPSGLTVFAITTLDDSLAALEAISTGADSSGLPTCPSS